MHAIEAFAIALIIISLISLVIAHPVFFLIVFILAAILYSCSD